MTKEITSATVKFRQMLDKRGIKWDMGAFPHEWCTYLRDMCAKPWDEKRLYVTALLTPKQAIDAMFGRGTCHNISRSEGSWLCSKCGAHLYKPHIDRSYLDEDGKRWYSTDLQGIWLHYCPSCGSEVER